MHRPRHPGATSLPSWKRGRSRLRESKSKTVRPPVPSDRPHLHSSSHFTAVIHEDIQIELLELLELYCELLIARFGLLDQK